ncbi:hypothetical protein ACLB2K_056133 [Fragaria x ananassa]
MDFFLGDDQEEVAENLPGVGQGGGGGGGQGGGDGVDHADLVDRVMQILNMLQHATQEIVAGQEWVSNGRQLIGNLPGLPARFTRALMGIYESQFQIQLCLGQIQLAINAIEPMFQAPVIEPFPDVIASVAEAHDVINAALVGLHSYLLVLVKAQIHAEAQARIQLGLGLFHLALRHCQEAFSIFEFLHDGHDWIWGEANVQEQA